MGADIYLDSAWKPFWDKLENGPQDSDAFSVTNYETSGGYFRNSYNDGDIKSTSRLLARLARAHSR